MEVEEMAAEVALVQVMLVAGMVVVETVAAIMAAAREKIQHIDRQR